jgi:hypothetical protein
MLAADPNWADIVLAVATAVGAVGLLFAIVAAFFAAQQVREARKSRHADMAAEFLRRWNERDLVETRRLVAQFRTPEELSAAFQRFIAANALDAYVLYRELDYFEQLGALVHVGAFDLELIEVLAGPMLIARWEMWKPSIDAMGTDVYPMFEALANRMQTALNQPHA